MSEVGSVSEKLIGRTLTLQRDTQVFQKVNRSVFFASVLPAKSLVELGEIGVFTNQTTGKSDKFIQWANTPPNDPNYKEPQYFKIFDLL